MDANIQTTFSLRPLVHTDATDIAELIGDWEVVRWTSSPPYPYSVTDAVEFLGKFAGSDSPNASHRAIEVDGKLAGAVGLDRQARGFNLGYWLGRAYWGRGIMTHAAGQLTRHFFAKTDETQLMSGYFSGNEASWAIQRRLGFEFVEDGLLMNRPQGKRMSHVLTRLTRARFEQLKIGLTTQSFPI